MAKAHSNSMRPHGSQGLGTLSVRAVRAAIACALVFLAAPHSALSESRGLTVELRTAEQATAPVAEQVELYDNSYALVIGNDSYSNGWPQLSNAVADAADIALALSEAGFEVTLKKNLDSADLRDALREFFVIQGGDPEARLLLWYAGHGHSLKGEGFLVPVDAPMPSDPVFKISALQMRDFGSLMRLAEAKHVLAIFDSCFSGTIFTTRAGAVPAAITKVTTRPTRQFMTSGDAEQQVGDDGTFRRLFLKALHGDSIADANGDGYLTGTELGLYMSNEMANYSDGAQTPRYGKLRDPDFDQGDFVFALPTRNVGKMDDFGSDVAPGEPAEIVEMMTEMTLWTTVVVSQDPAVVQSYLDTYPTGRFAKAALARIAELNRQIADAKAVEEAQAAAAAKAAAEATQVASIPPMPESGFAVPSLPSIDGRKVNTRAIAGDGRDLGWVYINNCGRSAAEVARIRKAINDYHFNALRLVPGLVANFPGNRPECAQESAIRVYSNTALGAATGVAGLAADELAVVLQRQKVVPQIVGEIDIGSIVDRYRFDVWLLPDVGGATVSPTTPPPQATQPTGPTCTVADVRPPDAWLALRSEPSSKSGRQLRKLLPGQEFVMLGDRRGDWYRVMLPDGQTGWVSWQVARWIQC